MIVKIMGGLGNQLFQYSFARHLKKEGHTVKLDFSYYKYKPSEDTERELIIDRLDKDFDTVSDLYGLLYETKFTNALLKKICPVCYDPRGGIVVDTGDLSEKTYFIGYWQNSKYFMDMQDEIKEIINSFLETEFLKSGDFCGLLKEIETSECPVAIHIRGGDYLNKTNVDAFGGVCGESYYSEALRLIRLKRGNPKFFVFTNDCGYAESILPKGEKYCFVGENKENSFSDVSELYLMTKCRDVIIANSTFSWWGAWLSNDANKTVIAPSVWNRLKNNPEIVLQDWIKI